MVDKSARPLSGEIMTGSAASRREDGVASDPEIFDAEYETVEPARSREATRFDARPPEDAPASGLGILRHDGVQADGRSGSDRGGPAFWSLGLGIVLLAFWVSGGHALIRNAPLFQPAPAAPELRIGSVESRIETNGDRALLFVDGEVVNEAQAVTPLRALAISVLDKQGRTTRYFLGTNGRRLKAGEHFSFSSRLVAPRAGVQSVSVTFKEPES